MVDTPAAPAARRRILIFRHPLAIRLTHWVNALSIIILIMSGLQIFNAHPALYWGMRSDFDKPIMSMTAAGPDGQQRGVTQLFGARFDTTGVLGLSSTQQGPEERGFPAWITLPSQHDLATGRRWHFFFAWLFAINGLAYLLYSLASRHLWRDLVPSLSDIRHVPVAIWEHLRLRFPKGEEARHYNPLQKLAYLGLVVVLIVLVLAGLTMSPGMDAAFPWLVDLFGGRQSARTIHFVCAALVVLFIIVHLAMVLVSGLWNNLRSMITGRYAITLEETRDARK